MYNLDDDLRDVINNSFGIAINANDFFEYNHTDMVLIYYSDLDWIMPIYKKYKINGLNACISYIAKLEPLDHYKNTGYINAYYELVQLNPIVESEY